MRTKYAKLAAMPGFQKLREACPILATWDDHDFGANDAGSDYPKKDESQKIFLDFFGDPPDSPRRKRPGVYDAARLRPAGQARPDDPARHPLLPQQPAQEEAAEPLIGQGPYVPNPDPNGDHPRRGPVAMAGRAAQGAGRGPPPRVEHPGRRRGPRLGEVDELPARARAALQADPRDRGRGRDHPERRPAPGRAVDDGRRRRLSDLRPHLERVQPGRAGPGGRWSRIATASPR